MANRITALRPARDAGRRPIPQRPAERLPMLLLGVAALIGALLLARLAPRGPDAFARYPRERVDRRPFDPEANPFPEHLRTPWRLYVHPDGSER